MASVSPGANPKALLGEQVGGVTPDAAPKRRQRQNSNTVPGSKVTAERRNEEVGEAGRTSREFSRRMEQFQSSPGSPRRPELLVGNTQTPRKLHGALALIRASAHP